MKSKHLELRKLTQSFSGFGVVYAFSDSENIVYIGSTKSFYSRLISHNSLNDKNSLRSKSGKTIYDFNISVITISEDLSTLKMLEQNAIDTYTYITGSKPRFNTANCYDGNKELYKYKDYL